MPVDTREALKVLQILSEQQNLRVNLHQSAKGGIIVGGCAMAGGVLGGPVGLTVGGVLGAITAGYYGRGKYKSVAYIIMYEMTPRQQQQLIDAVQNAVRDVRPEDFAMLLPLLLSNQSLQQAAISGITSFISSELNANILSN